MKNYFGYLRSLNNLGTLLSQKEICELCRQQSMHQLNFKIPTAGGQLFWETINLKNWKIQKNLLTGHIRILSKNNIRLSYGSEEQVLAPFLRKINENLKQSSVKDKNWGIVFSGGGAKGAFQIGVWKYLNENGISQKITGVSGSSVGALNCLLFANGSYEKAEKIWLAMKQKDMTTPSHKFLSNKAIFLLEKIENLMKTEIDWAKIKSTDKILYSTLSSVTLPHVPKTKILNISNIVTNPEYFCWSNCSADEIQKIILASAAIPLFYQPRSITNRLYIDGGWSDNIPANPLIKAGFSNIIVVHLDRESRKEHEIWKKSISGIESNKTKFYHIYPPKDFDDSILAIAKINPILTKSRMEAGYKAASKFINLS